MVTMKTNLNYYIGIGLFLFSMGLGACLVKKYVLPSIKDAFKVEQGYKINYDKIEICGVRHILCNDKLLEEKVATIKFGRGIDDAVGGYNTELERALALQENKGMHQPGDEIVYFKETDKVDPDGTSRPNNFSLRIGDKIKEFYIPSLDYLNIAHK